MKIITLNTWGGRGGEEKLLNFLKNKSNDVDIFCLQEVWSISDRNVLIKLAGKLNIIHEDIVLEMLNKINFLMPDFQIYFRPHYQDYYGLLILVRKNLVIKEEKDFFVYKNKDFVPDTHFGHHARNIQSIRIQFEGKEILIANFHGLWNGCGKQDSEDRLRQSKKIVSFLKKTGVQDIVVCGDFNLLPETKSIKIIEKSGFVNLVTKNKIKSTRSYYYDKPQKHANYIFTSKSIKVKSFAVIDEVVSDHLALIVEI